MIAESHAISPESFPETPLPVKALVVQYTTIKLIGQKLERRGSGMKPWSRLDYSDSPMLLVEINKHMSLSEEIPNLGKY